MTVRLEPNMKVLRQRDSRVYEVVSRELTGVQARDENGHTAFIMFGENIKLIESYRVQDAGDGMAGYIGDVHCGRCGRVDGIHPGGGNMCARCVSEI